MPLYFCWFTVDWQPYLRYGCMDACIHTYINYLDMVVNLPCIKLNMHSLINVDERFILTFIHKWVEDEWMNDCMHSCQYIYSSIHSFSTHLWVVWKWGWNRLCVWAQWGLMYLSLSLSLSLSRLPLPPGAALSLWQNAALFKELYFTKFPVSVSL